MHIPDSFIPLSQAIIYWIIALPFIFMSIRWAGKEMDDTKVPILAALAAGIFAIQALNIPIGMGTSGHMVGATLVAIIFASPWAGVLVLTLVLLVQGFVFADGGITTMGANILNMGVISGFVGYYTFSVLMNSRLNLQISSFVGAWLGLLVSALACAVQMYLAGTFPLVPGLIAMGTYHFIIGLIGEGLITAVAISAIASSRPDLLENKSLARGVKT
ncbi:ABC-type Co2+ transport system, permease component [Methanomethylovorans hollandica DSM 15978]|uniref:ABC-type Co2+ transport system, permease component n=1 Tax=Methanomethylovorans hollandica (strain DSM 15978 / NBRC 107637 / DMS1) TaxID=867904 RepID=L0KXQ8_METHD|nr:cobalt transporter CbiM [Methanomethylovorans hollandica]AGB48774.1 ABC-type Co2+ transport system, permease component [Methanomethylovorans hollandica DSM 15978]